MNILIYSDGSTYENTGVASTILLTETTYIGLIVRRYKVENASQTELLGILQALEYIHGREDITRDDKIIISTDAEYLVLVYQRLMGCGYVDRGRKYHAIWSKIMYIAKQYNISFIHMMSHQKDHNPNKMCDILGKVHRKCGTDTLVLG